MSGSISGIYPLSGSMPEDLETQTAKMFVNLRSVVEALGALMDDIVKVTVFKKDRNKRSPLNDE